MPNTPLPKDHQFQNPPKGKSHWALIEVMRNKNATLIDFVVAFQGMQLENPNLLNQQDGIGWTLLHHAVAQNRPNIRDWLVEAGANKFIEDDRNENPIQLQERLNKLPLWNPALIVGTSRS